VPVRVRADHPLDFSMIPIIAAQSGRMAIGTNPVRFRGGAPVSRQPRWLSVTATTMLLLTATSAQAATAVITPIDGPVGSTILTLADLSSDGSVVTGTIILSSGNEAFRWNRQTGAVPLPHLTSTHTRNIGYGISEDGSVLVGTATLDTGTQIDAFYWTSPEGTVNIGGVNDGISTYAYGISGDGSTVVGSRGALYPNLVTTAYRWNRADSFEFLGDLPGGADHSIALGASLDGSAVIGVSESASGLEAFLWRDGTGLIGLGDLPGGEYSSGPSDLSRDGRVVVGSSIVAGFNRSDHRRRAFRWTDETGLVDLGLLPDGATAAPSSFAFGVTSDGSIIVGGATSTRNQGAFLWTEADGMQSLWDILTADYGLNLSEWQLTSAEGISADGTAIIGVGLYQGQRQAWHVQLMAVPEPAALGLLATVGCWLGLGHQSRRRS